MIVNDSYQTIVHRLRETNTKSIHGTRDTNT